MKDLAGNALAANATSTFTTVAPVDTTPPTVTSFTPASGATGVATSGTIAIVFSEALNAATVSATTHHAEELEQYDHRCDGRLQCGQ